MLQLVYASICVRPSLSDNLATILLQSRQNNARDGISGLLWTNGIRFVQLLEGAEEAVNSTFGRIQTDDRHQEVEVVYQRMVSRRAFGRWKMALYDAADDELAQALWEADVETRFTLNRLILKHGMFGR